MIDQYRQHVEIPGSIGSLAAGILFLRGSLYIRLQRDQVKSLPYKTQKVRSTSDKRFHPFQPTDGLHQGSQPPAGCFPANTGHKDQPVFSR